MEKLLKFLLWTGGILGALIALGRLTVFEGWTVPEDPYLAASVAPTLRPGDYVIVLTVGEATFGDLVRCPDPDDNTRYVVGRIAGVSGDEVELQGPTLRINGTRYDASDSCKEALFTTPHPDTNTDVEMQCSRVDMGGGWHYRGTSRTYNRGNDTQKRVGIDNVFLLSDNRDLHDDSRDFGTLPHASCQQRVIFRLWGGEGWTDSDARLTFIH